MKKAFRTPVILLVALAALLVIVFNFFGMREQAKGDKAKDKADTSKKTATVAKTTCTMADILDTAKGNFDPKILDKIPFNPIACVPGAKMSRRDKCFESIGGEWKEVEDWDPLDLETCPRWYGRKIVGDLKNQKVYKDSIVSTKDFKKASNTRISGCELVNGDFTGKAPTDCAWECKYGRMSKECGAFVTQWDDSKGGYNCWLYGTNDPNSLNPQGDAKGWTAYYKTGGAINNCAGVGSTQGKNTSTGDYVQLSVGEFAKALGKEGSTEFLVNIQKTTGGKYLMPAATYEKGTREGDTSYVWKVIGDSSTSATFRIQINYQNQYVDNQYVLHPNWGGNKSCVNGTIRLGLPGGDEPKRWHLYRHKKNGSMVFFYEGCGYLVVDGTEARVTSSFSNASKFWMLPSNG